MTTERRFPPSVQPGKPKLGALQPGWKRHAIGDLFEVQSRPVALQDDEQYDLVTVRRSRGGVDFRSRLFGREISVKSQFQIREGDFLISKRQIVHGACGFVPAELDGAIVSNEYSVLRCSDVVDPGYLNQLIHSIYLQQTFFHSSIGVHIEKMIFKPEDWFKWSIKLPPISEQKRISTFLAAVDAKGDLLTSKRAALDDYKRGCLQGLFTKTLRFKDGQGRDFLDWKIVRVGQLGETFGGLSGKTAKDFGSGQPFVTYRQVFQKSYINFDECDFVQLGPNEKQNALRKGDILFTLSSEVPAEVGLASVILGDFGDVYLNSFCFALRPHEKVGLSPEFARFLFHSPGFRKLVFPLAQGSTRYNLAKPSFLKLRLSLPQVKEQQRIAELMTAIDYKIDLVNQELTCARRFKQGLIQQMFV